ncbi:PAP8 [Auxenochlorella protothecoides x Auxenochlorella symbiontica]
MRHPAAEQRVTALLSALQPSPASEARRLAIARLICSIIRKCFHNEFEVEAFLFGSVPLRTYLPDGDVDVSIFCSRRTDQATLRGVWAPRLVRALEWEARRGPVHLPIRDIQVIQAEVQLVKCIVSGVVVDISFETVGGLCTVAFLESMDRRIGRAHLFKRSILLIKAWCYYESRLLGAHHGLLSSYALETLVLNVINLHHSVVHTPLQVLAKFLEVYSSFEWERVGLSLQGALDLDALPQMKVTPQPMSQATPLLCPEFLAEALAQYAVPAAGPPPSFPRRHINIVDALLPGNNLGRSVSKASASRFASAFALGLRTLRGAVDRSPSGAIEGVDAFFKNAWQAPMRAAAEAAACLAGLASLGPLGWEGLVGNGAGTGQGPRAGPGLSPPPINMPPPPPPPRSQGQWGGGIPEGALPRALAPRPAWVSQRAQRAQQATAPWSPQPPSDGLQADLLRSDLAALLANMEAACRTRSPREGDDWPRGTASPARAEPLEPTAALADLSLRDSDGARMDPRGRDAGQPAAAGRPGEAMEAPSSPQAGSSDSTPTLPATRDAGNGASPGAENGALPGAENGALPGAGNGASPGAAGSGPRPPGATPAPPVSWSAVAMGLRRATIAETQRDPNSKTTSPKLRTTA